MTKSSDQTSEVQEAGKNPSQSEPNIQTGALKPEQSKPATEGGIPASSGGSLVNPTNSSISNPEEEDFLTPLSDEDPSLTPEKWMDWPVVPRLTQRMKMVYQKGQALGNDAHAFSKIGDCQNICEAFLCLYDQKGSYKLNLKEPDSYPQPEYHITGGDFSYLQETIGYFQGSWGRESMSVQGGFNFPAIFSPLRANPEYCNPGETPLVCEIRLHKPAFIIIGMEYWYKGRTAENYEGYLRKTVEYALERGIIPIVEAKADNLEGDHSLNITTAKIAKEYGLPLWNFWRAVQQMPDQGMDTRRDHADGFHINFDAQLMRSFTALQTMDSIRRDIERSHAAVATTTPSVAQTTPTLSAPKVRIEDTCPEKTADGAGQLVFNILRSGLDGNQAKGIYRLALGEKSTWQEISQEALRILDASAQGCRYLVNEKSNLYIANYDFSQRLLLTDRFYNAGENGAIWLKKSDYIIFVGEGDTGMPERLYRIRPDGTELTTLFDKDKTDVYPIRLFTSGDGKNIYWEAGDCSSGKCKEKGVFVTTLGTKPDTRGYDTLNHPSGAGHLGEYVTMAKDNKGQNRLAIGNVKNPEIHLLDIRTTHDIFTYHMPSSFLHYAWAPDNQTLCTISVDRSSYSGRPLEYRYFITPVTGKPSTILPEKLKDDLSVCTWINAGKQILFNGTEQVSNRYHLLMKMYDLETKRTITINTDTPQAFSEEDYIFIDRVFWNP